jgi:hypothetical protein
VKRLAAVGIALVAFLSSAVAVAARDTTLTGTAEWPTLFTTTIHGSFDGRLGRGTYEGTLNGGATFETPDCGPVCEPITGSIIFSGKRGSFTGIVQPGSVVALLDSSTLSVRAFTLTLSVGGGTRGYAHANGVLTLTYYSNWSHYFDPSLLEYVSFISDSGTLTGRLH